MHLSPSSSIQLHPASFTSTQLILTSTQLHPPPPSSFKPPPTSLQHPKRYNNQNIAPNWAISPNLHRKFKVVRFVWKWLSWHIGGADSESRIRTSKFRPQNPFLGKFGPKIQSCPFCLKIGTHGILKVLIRNLGIEFQNSDPKILFWANLGCKFKVVSFAWKLALMVYWRCWFQIQT